MSIVVTLLEGNYYKLVYYTLIYYLLLSLDPLPPSLSMLPNPHSLKYQTLYRRLLLKIAPTVKWMYI
jgi:hypothetical protein